MYKADITIVETCAIVSSANLRLKHKGYVAAAIAKEAGPDLERDCKEYVKKHGALKVTDVVPTFAGNLPCMKVLHAVGPRWGDYGDKNKNLCQILLAKTVLNCLETANNQNQTALTLSAIGAGKQWFLKILYVSMCFHEHALFCFVFMCLRICALYHVVILKYTEKVTSLNIHMLK